MESPSSSDHSSFFVGFGVLHVLSLFLSNVTFWFSEAVIYREEKMRRYLRKWTRDHGEDSAPSDVHKSLFTVNRLINRHSVFRSVRFFS